MSRHTYSTENERADVVAIVGCGTAKRDLEDGETVPIRDLYTSGYFTKKRQFAEELADRWLVLSAEHALANPRKEVEHYDRSIDDLEGEVLEDWKTSVALTLWRAIGPNDTAIVLAGRSYVDRLQEAIDERHNVDVDLVQPFENTTGIGDQNGWMADAIAAGDPFHDLGRGKTSPELATDGGQERGDDRDYWRRELSAFLENNDHAVDDIKGWARDDCPDDLAIVLEGEPSREARAELIHRLELAGFMVVSPTEEVVIRVAVRETRLEYRYSETPGVGDGDLMTDGSGESRGSISLLIWAGLAGTLIALVAVLGVFFA